MRPQRGRTNTTNPFFLEILNPSGIKASTANRIRRIQMLVTYPQRLIESVGFIHL